jgi:translation initiation factor 1 (eIF-1/SUI1)
MTKKNKNNLISNCCNARTEVVCSPDDIDKIGCTMYHKCLKCNCACDVHSNKRRVWIINPSTKVKGDKRAKIKNGLTKKEINEIRLTEDF